MKKMDDKFGDCHEFANVQIDIDESTGFSQQSSGINARNLGEFGFGDSKFIAGIVWHLKTVVNIPWFLGFQSQTLYSISRW